MKEQFVTYAEALELKKKGFNEPCLGYFFKGDLHYDRAPYAYNGDDHFEKLGFQVCTQVMKKYPDACLAPLKQQAFAFTNNAQTNTSNKTIICEKGDSITISIK